MKATQTDMYIHQHHSYISLAKHAITKHSIILHRAALLLLGYMSRNQAKGVAGFISPKRHANSIRRISHTTKKSSNQARRELYLYMNVPVLCIYIISWDIYVHNMA